MIIEGLLSLIGVLIYSIFGILPNIPTLEVQDTIMTYIELVFSNLDLLTVFIHINTLKMMIGVIAVVFSFDYIYKILYWIWEKIPIVGH